MYKVKEIYYTIQGEGYHTGRSAVFLRFSGCNLWSGREEDRHKAICKFCDTDFWGMDGQNGGKYTATALATKCLAIWDNTYDKPFVVITGGEPLLQLKDDLILELHEKGFEIAIETNGTLQAPAGIDWICVSPKANAEIVQISGHELKLVYPQKENLPNQFEHLDFENFYLQPLDDANQSYNTEQCTKYCLENPKWKLSLQMHKILGVE